MSDKFSRYAATNEQEDKFSRYKATPEQKENYSRKKSPKEESFLGKLPRNLLAGAAQAGHGLLNTPHALANLISPSLARHIPRQEDHNFAQMLGQEGEGTGADRLIQGATQYAPALLTPELSLGKVGEVIKKLPVAGKFLKKALGNALPVGAYTATQFEDKPLKEGAVAGASTIPFSGLASIAASAHPALRLAGRTGLAGLGAYAGHKVAEEAGGGDLASNLAGLLGAGIGITGINPKSTARRDVLKGVEGTNYKDSLEAAKRLGLTHLTPAEASANPFTGGTQGNLGKTEKGAQLLYKRGEERLKSEERAINNLYESISPKDADIHGLYEKAKKDTVPLENIEKLRADDPRINKAFEEIKLDEDYAPALEGVPENSIEYLKKVKEFLDNKESSALASGEKHRAKIRGEVTDKITDLMKEHSPDFEKANEAARRRFIKDDMIHAMRSDAKIGTSFFRKIIKNDETFKTYRDKLKDVPGATQQLDDMKLLFNNLINPPTVRTAAGLAKTSMSKERSDVQALTNKIKEALTAGRYDKAAVELMTNPNWAAELKKINELTSFEKKLSKTFDLLGRANAAYQADKNKKK